MTGQLLSLLLKGIDFCLFLTEGPQHPNTCQILPGGRSHAVQLSLDPAVHRHGDQHDTEDHKTQHRDHARKDRSSFDINGKGHDHCAEYHKGRPEQQSQGQIYAILDLVHIRSHPCDHGRGTHPVDFRIGQAQQMLHHRMTQTGSKTHRRFRREILCSHSAGKAHNTEKDHNQHHFDHIALVLASNANIHDFCHHQRNQQFEGCLQQFKQRAKNTFLAITPNVFEYLFQVVHPEVDILFIIAGFIEESNVFSRR